MEKESYSFSSFNDHSSQGISNALNNFNKNCDTPIIICVGSDLVLGDTLGPLTGTLLKRKNIKCYIYGTLNYPITAKEIEYAKIHLKQMHPSSTIIAIDAAVGCAEDIGLIKVSNAGLLPGIGVDKKLGSIGDISIIGVVAEKSNKNYNLFNLTRLSLVYKMADCISNGINTYLQTYFKDKNIVNI